MAQFSGVQDHPRRRLKANYLLVQNINALLSARGEDAKALAMWTGHKPPWISKILSGDRGMRTDDLDKVADFFGLTVAQLFQHGISGLTERRRAARRTGTDRRGGKDRRGASDGRLHPEMRSPFPRDRREDDDGNAEGAA